MKTYLIALPPDWESRLRQALLRRGQTPNILPRGDFKRVTFQTDKPAIAVFHANDSLEHTLDACRRLRVMLPSQKLKILLCGSTIPDKQSWPIYQRAGVDLFLPATFTDAELEFRLATAECLLTSTSPSGDASPPADEDIDFTPDVENVPYGLFQSTLNNKFLKVNDGLVHILGYSSKEELLGVDIARDLYADPLERAWLMATIQPQNKTLEVTWKRRDGSLVDLQLSGHTVVDETHNTFYMQVIAWDITEQKRSRKLLLLQRDLGIALSRSSTLQQTLDAVLDTVMQIDGVDCGGIYLVEEETRIHRMAASCGLSPQGAEIVAVATPDLFFVPRCEEGNPIYLQEEEFDPLLKEWSRSEGMIAQAILPIMHDGKLIATLNLASRTKTDFSPATRLAVESIATRIGGSIARVQAEESLRASQSNLQTLFDAMDDLVLVVDFQGKILHYNLAVKKRLGYASEELQDMHITALYPAERLEEIFDSLKLLDEGRQTVCCVPFKTKGGDLLPVETRVVLGTWAGQKVGFGVARDLSEREASRKALEQSEARFRAIFENASVGIGLSDLSGRLLDVNEAVAQMEGLPRNEIIGRHFREFTTPEDGAIQSKLHEEMIEGRIQSYELEKRYFNRENQPFWVRCFCSLVPAPPGEKPQYLITVVENIDARKRVEEALRESENRYRIIAENASDVVWTGQWTLPDFAGGLPSLDDPAAAVNELLRGWRFEYVSPSVEKMLGYNAEESLKNTPATHMDPQWYPAVARILLDNLTERPPSQVFEFSMIAKDGSTRWCEVTINTILTPPGEPLRMMGIMRDISARHAAEEALRDSENRYRMITDNVDDVVWSAHWTPPDLSDCGDPQSLFQTAMQGWRFEYVSPSVERLFGFSVEECISDLPDYRIVPESFPSIALEVLRGLALHGAGEPFRQTFEISLFDKAGALHWCEVTVTFLRTEPGDPLRILGILRDITARHETREALRKSEGQFRLLFENLPDMVMLLDQDAVVRFINHGSPDLSSETLSSASIFSFVNQSDLTQARQQFAKAQTTKEVQTVEVLSVTNRHWTCRIVPMTQAGIVDHWMVICTETTEQKKAAEAIRQEQKLLQRLIDLQERERRFLSYEIHDGFAQQITGALFHLEAFQRLRSSNEAAAEKNLDHAAAMLRRSIDETRRLISGLRPPILDEAGILAAVEYLVCENRERSGIDIMFKHNLQAARLAAPLESAVFRIVQESLTNACRHSQSDFIRVELQEKDHRLQIMIFDEGVGFDPSTVSDDRFGLRSIRERARLLGGKADIESAPGEGCLIRVELPLVLGLGS